ncbi:epoxide hydrolase family protein [Kribbella sp. NPDC005582]|uniref:epoxide hydrolase family protein n=1 Tax=Kribbella sp. NPDC005582 TaxID=3156893 RepID=UPI0033BD4509
MEVPEAQLTELRRRLSGVDDELAAYWRDDYDWRAWERRLNEYPQFTTTIDGTNIHFLHVRSPRPNAFPLILTHGWPGSVVEYVDVIGPLTELGYDLVIPSLPGYTWSGPTPARGWGPRRIARAWATLMQRLGYDRYGAAGNDWGSHISPELGRVAPEAVAGAHVTQFFCFPEGEWLAYPPTTEPDRSVLSPADQAALDSLRELQRSNGSYAHVHGQRPHILGAALNDSPVGLLTWNRQAMGGLEPNTLLTHVTAYWLTGTAGSAMQLYAEYERQPAPDRPTTVPLALSQFRDDLRSIRAYAERDHANIVSWIEHGTGGHYAAHQAPDLLVGDLHNFFQDVRASS